MTNTPLDSIHYFRNIVSSIYCNDGFCKHLYYVKLKDKIKMYCNFREKRKCKTKN